MICDVVMNEVTDKFPQENNTCVPTFLEVLECW